MIRASANSETLKLANIRNRIENISTENMLQNCINQELNVSWNATKIELHTCDKLVHKKYNDIIFITFVASTAWKWWIANRSALKNSKQKIIIQVTNCIKKESQIVFFICHFLPSSRYFGKKYCIDSVNQRSL